MVGVSLAGKRRRHSAGRGHTPLACGAARELVRAPSLLVVRAPRGGWYDSSWGDGYGRGHSHLPLRSAPLAHRAGWLPRPEQDRVNSSLLGCSSVAEGCWARGGKTSDRGGGCATRPFLRGRTPPPRYSALPAAPWHSLQRQQSQLSRSRGRASPARSPPPCPSATSTAASRRQPDARRSSPRPSAALSSAALGVYRRERGPQGLGLCRQPGRRPPLIRYSPLRPRTSAGRYSPAAQ